MNPVTAELLEAAPGYATRPQQDEADYLVFPPDTRRRVTSTNRITDAPYRYICQIVIRTGGRTFVGAGTLVGPRTVLTAAHNLFSPLNGRRLPAANLTITPARNGGDPPAFGASLARRLIPSPGYDHRRDHNTRRDFAVIQLRDALGSRAGWWGQRPRPAFDDLGTSLSTRLPQNPGVLRVNLSGYPVDKGGATQWRSYNRTIRLRDGLLSYENDTEAGHSGSPVWVRRDRSMGGRVLVGVHIGFDPVTRASNRAVAITDDILRFIATNTV